MDIDKKRLLIVIVNYKSSKLACMALAALLPQIDAQKDKVVIVDNNSEDESLNVLTNFINDK